MEEALYELAFAGDQKVFGVGTFAGLNRSEDGGRTWTKVKVDTGGWLLSRVDFVNDRTGWVAGDQVLLKTEDGGNMWTRSEFTTWLHNIDIDFVNPRVGYVAGDTRLCNRLEPENCTDGNKILKTVDGGKTWKQVYADTVSGTVFQLKAINENTVFVLNNASTVRRTVDGGRTWEVTYTNRNAAQQLAVSPDGVIWLAGESSLLRSDDQGLTWKQPPALPEAFRTEKWHAIELSPGGYGVVAGDGSRVGITLDGGKSWSDLYSPNIHFGLMFHVAIRGKQVVVAASNSTANDTVYRLELP